MRNIIRIFLSDFRRITTNVVAVVVIIGLSVIPCLYAWFNIFSNWAPYDEEATGRLQVAVVSMDEGIELEGVEVNVGSILISNLKENKSINWQFVDNDVEAVEDVKTGKYYACFVVDEDFSKDMISFIGGNTRHPVITYYENDKKNAIAPKITGKVKTAIQQGINTSFVGTLTKGVLTVSADLSGVAGDSKVQSAIGTRLTTIDNDLSTCITILDTYISLIDTTTSLMEAAEKISDESEDVLESVAVLSDSAKIALESAGSTVDAASDMVNTNLDQLAYRLDALEKTMDGYLSDAEKAVAVTNAEIESIRIIVGNLQDQFAAVRKQLNAAGAKPGDSVTKKADTVDADLTRIDNDLSSIQKANNDTYDDVEDIYKLIKTDIRNCRKDIRKLSTEYENTLKPQLNTTLNSVKKSVEELKSMLQFTGKGVEQLVGILGSYPEVISLGSDKLQESRAEIVKMQNALRFLMGKMDATSKGEQYQMFMRLLQTSPDQIAEFITSPINLSTEAIYPVENNGSAMAPFYVVLSIWVGSLILVAIIHTKVKPIEGVTNMHVYEEYFGRYIVFYLIGQVQTLITVMGALLYVGIQCEHPFLFWFAMSVTSFTYTLFLYSLTYAFEAVGEAIAVVLMVIQVAGSGGTFPVEVLPKFYQVLYEYMPFAYSISAAREALAGMYENDYWMYLSKLGIYVAASLIIGLLVSIPMRKMNIIIKQSTAGTDLMV